jgi:MFS family permease
MALSILLIQERGMDLLQIGLLMGIYSLTVALLEVPTGGLADAIGRKRVAVLAYIIMMVSTGVLMFSFIFPLILGSFILMGVGRALSSGALDAWFVDELLRIDPEIDLQPPLAKAGTFTLLSLGLGALFGSLIPQLFRGIPLGESYELTPLAMPFIFAFFTSLILVLVTVLLVKEHREATEGGNWKQGFQDVPVIVRTGFSLSRRNPTILLLLGTTVASGFALSGLESFWQPHFANLLGGSQGNTLIFGVIMGGNFLFGMLGNMLATPLTRLLNKRYALVGAIFQGTWGAAIFLLALQSGVLSAVTFFWLTYMSMGVINSPHNTLLNREIPSEQRSAMLSIASLTTYIGGVLGGAALGYVAKHASINQAWAIAGMVLVVSLSLYWRIDARQSGKHLPLTEAHQEMQS